MQAFRIATVAAAVFATSQVALANEPAVSGVKAAPAAAAGAQAATAAAGTLSDRSAARRDADSRVQVRDWSKIDTNRDHLISPAEMEAYLEANPGPLREGKS